MDIPRQRPAPTWRNTAWWQATWQSTLSGLLMTAIALPLVAWFSTQLMRFSHQPFDCHLMLSELAKGSLAMLPYLWAYFFALERIARQRNKDDSPHLHNHS